jgi:diguanylate cyclase (GGDEF)-like protein
MMNRVSDKPSVLIVDDAPENIDVLIGILRNDYRILVANNGERAQEICRRHLPDLILLDVMMPGLDGHEVCRRLKQDPATSDIPVIFVSAATRDEDEVEGLAAGAVDFLAKPVNAPIVAARVRTHVELKQQRDMLRKLSQVDDLTGVASRQCFEEVLARESRRCTRGQSTMALLLVDIDFFKNFNEVYGHQVGDSCLRRVAATLTTCLGRPGDLVARLNGDRFGCVLPDSDLGGLRHVAQRIARDVADLSIPHARPETGDYLTVTMAGLVATPEPDWALSSLLPRTEELLAHAKAEGRARSLISTLEDAAKPEVLTNASSHGFDPDVGLRRTGGVRERYRSFVTRFITEHAGDAKLIEDDLARGDRADARRLAHTLESVAGSLGAIALADMAERMSSLLADGKDPTAELARFRKEMQATLREMHRTVGSGPAPAIDADAAPVVAIELKRVVGELTALIAHYDAEAIWLFERHRQAIKQGLTPEQFQRLDAALNHFDYDSAMHALHDAMSGASQ